MAATEKRTAVKETAAKEIKLPYLISQFNKESAKTRFCFILGAGASRSSGIRMASELIEAWEKDLSESETEESLALWKKEKGITKDNYKEFYGDYYKRRFTDYRDGYDYLEKEMEGKLPGSGYILLAHVLCHTPHNIVITTNFDHLIEDAVNQWEHRFPLVIGHESLAHFIADDMDRPVIIKIHHDLLFGPKNRNDETNILDSKWQEHLPKIFSHYHPVFLGYAGNDLSLMNYLLENAAKFKKGEWRSPYWTAYGSKPLSGKPLDFIKSADGVYLRDCDFDSFMAALAQQIGYIIPPKKTFINMAKEKAEQDYDRLNTAINKNDNLLIPDCNNTDSKENEQIVSNAIMSITQNADNTNKGNAASTYRKAIRAYNKNNYSLMERLFNALIKLDPDNAQYHDSLSVSLHAKARYEEALLETQKAIELDPNNAKYHHSLSITLHAMKRYEEALQQNCKAIELDPDNASYHYCQAITLHEMKNYKEALLEIQKAIELDPDNAKYLYSLGITQHSLKHYKDALQATQKAIELEPDNALYHNSLGVTLHKMKNYKAALQEKQKAIELNPDNALYYNSFGVTLRALKRHDEALQKTQKAIELDPDNAQYYNSLGITLREMKRYDDSLQEVRKAINLDPDNAEYHESLGTTLHAMKHYEEALKEKQKAVELESDNAEYHNSLGVTLHAMKRYEEALKEKQKAVDLEPDNEQYKQSLEDTKRKMK
ncbi:tetratricopeptide repeat protein [Clostridiales bacterium FE2010]|nr:tetratricopeptide repeat protein [Clostridiales bacterium FE2010]